ncbi:transcriptional regulator, MarR family [Caulobacter segnis ATCC 21756]|uniref:Transcriptional regulator, MarR family n=2 Tax=Caulobacter segnis TaxID=88688 RepID=D5VK00_CAUST|nr:transcriptional regulator, MarR family [Caulobacter segnis ATCC 21756]
MECRPYSRPVGANPVAVLDNTAHEKDASMTSAAKRKAETEPTPSLGGLETTVGFVLRLAQVAVFKDLLAALKPFDLRVTDLSVLLVIEATPGLQQRAIGDMLRIQRPNLVIILDQLQARGLVRRDPVPGDRRSYALSITPEGAALLRGAKAAHAAHDRKVLEALGDLEKERMLTVLERIAAI